jgi:hypothetical protein
MIWSWGCDWLEDAVYDSLIVCQQAVSAGSRVQLMYNRLRLSTTGAASQQQNERKVEEARQRVRNSVSPRLSISSVSSTCCLSVVAHVGLSLELLLGGDGHLHLLAALDDLRDVVDVLDGGSGRVTGHGDGSRHWSRYADDDVQGAAALLAVTAASAQAAVLAAALHHSRCSSTAQRQSGVRRGEELVLLYSDGRLSPDAAR